MQPVQESTPRISLASISVRDGHNPRKRFREEAVERMANSIRSEGGLIQPITVRRIGEQQYELVSGETRVRALRSLGETEAPAHIIDCDAATARRLALRENIDRTDLVPMEEAIAAQFVVDDRDGDRDAAASELGWTRAKLDHRLQLLHATEAVRDALIEDRIKIGHAELLSTLPQETQDQVLAKVIDQSATVQTLKEQLQGVSLSLEQARFNMADCRQCPHNSQVQGALFENAISGGRCTNRPCYQAKTDAWVDAERERLREEYPVVSLLTEKVPERAIPLVRFGDNGVGDAQFAACRGCQFRGCVLDNRLGATTGNLEAPVCSNRECHDEKVGEYQATIAPAGQVDEPAPSDGDTAAVAGKPRTVKSMAKPKRAGKAAVAKANPESVEREVQAILRRALTARLQTDPVLLLAIAAYATGRLAETESGSGMGTVLGIKSKDFGSAGHEAALIGLLKQDKDALQRRVMQNALALINERADEVTGFHSTNFKRRDLIPKLVGELGLDVLPFVKIDESFLSAHTKPAIEELLEQSGFKAWMLAKDDGAKQYRALTTGSKGDMVKGIVAADYDFTAFTPPAVIDRVKAR